MCVYVCVCVCMCVRAGGRAAERAGVYAHACLLGSGNLLTFRWLCSSFPRIGVAGMQSSEIEGPSHVVSQWLCHEVAGSVMYVIAVHRHV